MNGIMLILAASGASAAVWGWQNRKLIAHRRRHRAYLETLDADAEIALGVANHEATSRGQRLSSLHLLYGLLQLEAFTAAIGKLGGDVADLEQRVHNQLDMATGDPDDLRPMLTRAAYIGVQHHRRVTHVDFWYGLSRTEPARLLGELAPDLLFALVHGSAAPIIAVPNATAVHIVLRNDDYTSREFVVAVVRELFELPETDAVKLMMKTHDEGRAVIGRLDATVAKQKLEAARARAREAGFPLWVGAEAC